MKTAGASFEDSGSGAVVVGDHSGAREGKPMGLGERLTPQDAEDRFRRGGGLGGDDAGGGASPSLAQHGRGRRESAGSGDCGSGTRSLVSDRLWWDCERRLKGLTLERLFLFARLGIAHGERHFWQWVRPDQAADVGGGQQQQGCYSHERQKYVTWEANSPSSKNCSSSSRSQEFERRSGRDEGGRTEGVATAIGAV